LFLKTITDVENRYMPRLPQSQATGFETIILSVGCGLPSLTGPWTTNTAAVLTTNSQAGGYQFSIPTPGSVEFYQVRSP
jgi:hypothetical protein